MKARRTRRQLKSTPIRRSQQVEGRQCRKARELTRALKAVNSAIGVKERGTRRVEERWTIGVVGCRTKPDKEHEQGMKTLGEVKVVDTMNRPQVELDEEC